MGTIGEKYLTKKEFETYVRQVNKSLSSLRITQPGTTGGGTISHFTGLSDVPGSYSGQAGKAVVVNAGENALAFITLNQAAIIDLKITDSPVFVTVALSGLNAGYIPYQVGGILDNSVLFCQGNNLGMGMASFGAGADYVFALMNGTAPAAHGDCFQLYSADFGGGADLACPHIMIENGTIVRLNQDISTLASPVFVTVKCSGLIDGYIPYHGSDALGLVNGNFRTNGSTFGIGIGPQTDSLFYLYGDYTVGATQYGYMTDPILSGTTISIAHAEQGSVKAGVAVTNWISLYIPNPTLGGGSTIANHYGLYISEPIRGGTANWPIYVTGGTSYFGGLVQCASFRMDQVPAAGAITPDKYVTMSFNGVSYKVPCVAA